MNILIELHYVSAGNKIYQAGDFPLRGKLKEQIVLDWWDKIRKEMPFGAQLEKVMVDGEDVTEQMKDYLNQ